MLHVVEATVETFMMQLWKHIVSIGGSILEAYACKVVGHKRASKGQRLCVPDGKR
jgi:hypothetical protein